MCSISFQVLGGDVIAVQLNKTKGEASQGQTHTSVAKKKTV
jgi:hypothetical protein